MTRLASEAGRKLGQRVVDRVGRLRRAVQNHPDAVLRLELSDVCPCAWEQCTTPQARWTELSSTAPEVPTADNWTDLRDQGVVDFGRGFMGFEVLESMVRDLSARRIRFGTLALRWRGEPLLHPEAHRIIGFLLDTIGAGRVADRLRIETDGSFLSPQIAALAAHPAPQLWVVDLDRGGVKAQEALVLLQSHRGPGTRLVLAKTADGEFDLGALAEANPSLSPVAGRLPTQGDALWIRRSDHAHFQANASARAVLAQAAEALGVSADLGEEDQPRLCRAPQRSPTVSWDGKLALCPQDTQLQQIVGDVIAEPLSAAWSGHRAESARRDCASRGTPNLPLCADCPMPWSPNHD